MSPNISYITKFADGVRLYEYNATSKADSPICFKSDFGVVELCRHFKLKNWATHTWPNILLNNLHVLVSVVSGVHVKEAEDVHPLVNNGGVAEASDTGHVAGQIERVGASGFPEANMGEAATCSALANDVR